MKKLDRITDRLCAVLIRSSAVILVLIMFFVFVNVVLRLTVKKAIFGSTELVRYAALTGAALALAQNEWFDGNIRVTMALDLLPKKAASAVAFIAYALTSCGVGYVSFLLLQQAMKYYRSNTLTSELSMPTGLFVGILSFGFMLLTVIFIIRTIFFGYRLFSKAPDNTLGAHRAPVE